MKAIRSLLVVFIALLASVLSAEADMVSELVDQAKASGQDQKSCQQIPEFSEEKKNEIAANLNSIDTTVELEKTGAEIRDLEIAKDANSAASITDSASSIKRLENTENYHQLDMFTKGDDVMRDPVSAMAELSKEKCRELINNDKNKGYHATNIIENKQEKIAGELSCEIGGLKLECNKELKLTCNNKRTNCDFGGLVKDSVESDMTLDYSGGTLTLGNTTREAWRGTCLIIDRLTSFNILNLDQITEFRLVEVSWDDYIKLDLNGHQIFIGPEDGNKLEIHDLGRWIGQQVWNGKSHHACERNTDWQRIVNIDLRPYLKEGKNTIAMRVIVSGSGEGWIRIQAKQHCCDHWNEEWITTCATNSGLGVNKEAR